MFFNKQLGEVKRMFNVPSFIGSAADNQYRSHADFVKEIHQSKLSFDKFKVEIFNPIKSLEDKLTA